ncbi:MAG: hypothetical protein K2N05_11395 [Muribaculaceae bacterium]|nr:hypothetical protein [Muribaculaceae bacterium]
MKNKITMDKILTVKTKDSEVAQIIKEDLTSYLQEYVNCTWYNGSWEVVAVVCEADYRAIIEQIEQSENYADGKLDYEVENEE